MYDIIVIGAGVTGTCTARELSKYQVNMCVIDKGDDVASGTSKANSGIVHGGYDCKPGTLMAEMNVRGNELLYELAEDLDYPIKKNGSLIVCTVPGERGKLDVLLEQAKENGVPGCRIIDKEEALKREREETVIGKIIENAQMDIPEQMVEAQTRQMTQEFAQRLQSQGLSLEQYMQFTGLTPQKMMEDLEPQALKRIQSRLVLEAVVAAENIEASDEEIDKELENMASMYQMEIDKLKELIGDDEKKQIGMDLAVQKAVEFVVKEAVEK